MKKMVFQFLWEDAGATAIEYALLAALIAIVAMVGANTLGQNLARSLNNTAARL